MFGNYLKTALRNLARRKLFSFINIAGLALGMAVSFLILLFVWNEVTYDRFHKNAPSIFRLATKVEMQDRRLDVPGVPAPLGPALVGRFPEVVRAMRLRRQGGGIFSFNDRLFEESAFIYVDPDIFNVFTIRVVSGDPKTMLTVPFSLVLTEETAKKWYGAENPVGKIVKLNNRDSYTISGVVRKMPENSHIKFSVLASLSTFEKIRSDLNEWMSFNYMTYIQLAGKPDVVTAAKKYYDLLMANMPDQFKSLGAKISIFLQPLRSIHLNSHLEGELEPPGNPAFIRVLVTIALFILLIACINFMNLSTAHSARRAKEVGLRKILGAERKKLIAQFLGESLLLSLISLVLALGLIVLLLPVFNRLLVRSLSLNGLPGGGLLLGLGGIALFVGLAAGAYPALFLSSFGPLEALKSRFKAGRAHGFLRSGLVTMQYIISIALIFSTLVIHSQLGFVKNFDLGFNKDRVIEIGLRGGIARGLEAFKNELLGLPGVAKAGWSSGLNNTNETIFSFEGAGTEKPVLPIMDVGPGFMDVLEIKLAAGRNFSPDNPSDKKALIINETLARQIGWKDPLGKIVKMTDVDEKKNFVEVPYTVIGVIRDFHFASLHEKVRGQLLRMSDDNISALYVKVRPQGLPDTLKSIEGIWRKMEPAYPFRYSFLDDAFDKLYRTEIRMGQIFIGLTLIAIFVASLGLLGLASFNVEQRTKEIGIRKVLGASIPRVVLLLSKEFSKWVLLANVIAWPIAYLAMSRWLRAFAYRIEIGPWMFLASGAVALAIALLTISAKTVRAAASNPVYSLRYE